MAAKMRTKSFKMLRHDSREKCIEATVRQSILYSSLVSSRVDRGVRLPASRGSDDPTRIGSGSFRWALDCGARLLVFGGCYVCFLACVWHEVGVWSLANLATIGSGVSSIVGQSRHDSGRAALRSDGSRAGQPCRSCRCCGQRPCANSTRC